VPPAGASASGQGAGVPSGASTASRHSMWSSGFRIGSVGVGMAWRRAHWIAPIHTTTRASSAA
jgi:hypothetical protein